MKTILMLFALLLMFPFSIQSQNITVTKTSKHTYQNDSLTCMDKTAANRVMADKYNLQLLENGISQLDSAYSAKTVENDSLKNQNIDLQNELALCNSDRIWQDIKHKNQIKTCRIITWTLAAITIILTATQIK